MCVTSIEAAMAGIILKGPIGGDGTNGFCRHSGEFAHPCEIVDASQFALEDGESVKTPLRRIALRVCAWMLRAPSSAMVQVSLISSLYERTGAIWTKVQTPALTVRNRLAVSEASNLSDCLFQLVIG